MFVPYPQSTFTHNPGKTKNITNVEWSFSISTYNHTFRWLEYHSCINSYFEKPTLNIIGLKRVKFLLFAVFRI